MTNSKRFYNLGARASLGEYSDSDRNKRKPAIAQFYLFLGQIPGILMEENKMSRRLNVFRVEPWEAVCVTRGIVEDEDNWSFLAGGTDESKNGVRIWDHRKVLEKGLDKDLGLDLLWIKCNSTKTVPGMLRRCGPFGGQEARWDFFERERMSRLFGCDYPGMFFWIDRLGADRDSAMKDFASREFNQPRLSWNPDASPEELERVADFLMKEARKLRKRR